VSQRDHDQLPSHASAGLLEDHRSCQVFKLLDYLLQVGTGLIHYAKMESGCCPAALYIEGNPTNSNQTKIYAEIQGINSKHTTRDAAVRCTQPDQACASACRQQSIIALDGQNKPHPLLWLCSRTF